MKGTVFNMNENFFYELLDKSEKRRFDLLKFFNSTKNDISFQSICKSLNVTFYTLNSDIHILNILLKDKVRINLDYSSKFIEFTKTEDTNEIKKLYFKQSNTIKLLYLIVKKSESILGISDDLHISQSSCYLYIKRIKLVLKKYNISLTNKNTNIEGRESNIRILIYLLNNLFLKTTIDQQYVDLFHKFEEFGVKIFMCHKLNVQNFMIMMIKRNKEKKFINIEKDLINKIKYHPLYVKLNHIYVDFFNTRGVNLIECEVIYSFIFIVTNFNYTLKNNEDLIVYQDTNNLIELHNEIKELIYLIEPKISFSLSEKHEYYNYIIQFFIKRYVNMKYIPHEYRSFSEKHVDFNELNINHAQNNMFNIFNLISKPILTWAQKYNYKYILKKDIEDLSVLLETFQFQSRKKINKILIYLSRGEVWEYFIKSQISNILGSNTSVTLYSEMDYTCSDLNNHEFDAIIADSHIDIDKKIDIVYINDPSDIKVLYELKYKLEYS